MSNNSFTSNRLPRSFWACSFSMVTMISGVEFRREARSDRPVRDADSRESPDFVISFQALRESELFRSILFVVTKHPGLDDEEIALHVGVTPVEASRLLLRMEEDGLLIGR